MNVAAGKKKCNRKVMYIGLLAEAIPLAPISEIRLLLKAGNNLIITLHAIKPSVPQTHQEPALKLKHLRLTTNSLTSKLVILYQL